MSTTAQDDEIDVEIDQFIVKTWIKAQKKQGGAGDKYRELMSIIRQREHDAELRGRYASEVWYPYHNTPYDVSSAGRVRRGGKILTLSNASADKNSYKVVSVSVENKRKNQLVHRMVAETFLFNHEHKPTVNHIDGNKSNNVVSNLEWATYAENEQHSFNVLGKTPVNKGVTAEYCLHGHAMASDNLYIDRTGRHHCMTCKNDRQRKRRAELKKLQGENNGNN